MRDSHSRRVCSFVDLFALDWVGGFGGSESEEDFVSPDHQTFVNSLTVIRDRGIFTMGEQQERPAMDAQLKAKWIEALRNGEFRQGQSMLHDDRANSYCCLGVLCKVAGAEWGEFEKMVEGDEGYYGKTYSHVPVLNGEMLGSTDDEELEDAACKKFGIPVQSVLILMNDGFGKPGMESYEPPKTFPEIADYIEANL